jgi:hypothetical protein
VVVSRSWGATAAQAITDNDVLVVVGTAIAEGATSRSSKYTDPTRVYNLTQIFRHPWKLTGTAQATVLRTGAPYKDMKREAMDDHTVDMERAFLFGEMREDLTGDEPRRTTGGIESFLTTNVTTVSGGNLTFSALMAYYEELFKYGTSDKLCFCGSSYLRVISEMAEARGQVNLEPGGKVYGVAVQKLVTPFGNVSLHNHPLFNENAVHQTWGMHIEPKDIAYRYLNGNGKNRDTDLLKNRQANDEDAIKDEFLTEAGLEVNHERHHGILKNVQNYSAT